MQHIVRTVALSGNVSDATVIRTTLADYFRDAIPQTDSVQVTRKRQTPPPPNMNVVALAELRESVAELVGTLRQVAGLSRKSGETENHREIERLLPKARDIVEFLDLLKHAYVRADSGDILL